ncbi:MAG: PIN domain-containing protein [Chloroflexi bacterium]|nr:PIN domain-containing protein [Chloroflexota bacterium]
MSADHSLVFVDTNILVYAYDRSAGQKRERARSFLDQLWTANLGCVSVQVLQEFYVAVTQKVQKPLPQQAAADIVRDLAFWRVHAPVAEDILGAIDLQRRHKISFWDAMILWSASQLACATLWSEDLAANRTYDGVMVQNPFLS